MCKGTVADARVFSTAGDFEVIPAVRSVVVLDDATFADELDCAWEHVSRAAAVGTKPVKAAPITTPSYAQVVAAKH